MQISLTLLRSNSELGAITLFWDISVTFSWDQISSLAREPSLGVLLIYERNRFDCEPQFHRPSETFSGENLLLKIKISSLVEFGKFSQIYSCSSTSIEVFNQNVHFQSFIQLSTYLRPQSESWASVLVSCRCQAEARPPHHT